MEERWLGKFVHCEPCSANPKVGTHAKNLWLGFEGSPCCSQRLAAQRLIFWIHGQFEA
jgi:hypothetical protein